ncbi:ribose 5-phosphate isomerase B [Candidatus Aerophobetes bacterium]|uniref:Ribose 5-phosphate isomerase B n=1 Tax=Aerophobetes bacterium TaxID=2030807 RepID=A0A523V1V2_UNCAE|nr:MAG: ribose 5-phosphate isomerase B [Candidatus Aerophobetes bacterium]
MKAAIGADHAGYELKEEIKNLLKKKGIECYDFGTHSSQNVKDNYPDYAIKVAEAVAGGGYERGILICGAGVGMGMAANKVPGVRAAPCCDTLTARLSRQHNDSNVLTLGARITDKELAKKIVEEWLKTEFEGGRHKRRVEKITQIEKKYGRLV